MLTKVIVHADYMMGYYVSTSYRFSRAKPVEIEILGSDVVDLGRNN
jgi:hypothetical protein